MKSTLQNIFIIISLLIATASLADNYPRTASERKDEEMDSILGGEGLIYRSGRVRNESTKKVSNGIVNKYLWQAATEILDFAPLNSTDSVGGIITTDWYSAKGYPDHSYKINLFIKGEVISPESIEVRVFERLRKNGDWVQVDKLSALGVNLEDRIVRRAREIYIQSATK